MEKKAEHRRLERRDYSGRILLEFNDQTSGTYDPVQIEGCGVDLNSQGIGILAEKPIDPGGVVKLYLPFGDPETVIPTFSEVRWTRPTEGRYRMGLHFIF
jgi:hypothetical protein